MSKVIDYDYVEVQEVNVNLQDGWQPWGSPYAENGITYQAMVKYKEYTLNDCLSDTNE